MRNDVVMPLFRTWVEALYKAQIRDSSNPALNGGLLCPECGFVHGRCFEAIYPFMLASDLDNDERWVKAAELLFEWAENNVSEPDGSYKNDIDASWHGTTVFNTSAVLLALTRHSKRMDDAFKKRLEERFHRASEYLFNEADNLKNNNVNYPLSNALTLYRAGLYYHEERYIKKAAELSALFYESVSKGGLIIGEGRPRLGRTIKGCSPVDIGYNVEETIPSLLFYAMESGNNQLFSDVKKVFEAHMAFFLPDGGWDNSFGTRNFKWTYYGSRTSDGALSAAALLAADRLFAAAATSMLALLKKSTETDGLLAGGPGYEAAGAKACIHHTFTHIKPLAEIIDLNLDWNEEKNYVFPRFREEAIAYYPEVRVWVMKNRNVTATVSDYDWDYIPNGHASSGSLSLLYDKNAGLLTASSLGVYTLKEPRNMQRTEKLRRHENLSPRIETKLGSTVYSSLNDKNTEIVSDGKTITVSGTLKDNEGKTPIARDCWFRISYTLLEDGIRISASAGSGELIVPVVTDEESMMKRKGNAVLIERGKHCIELTSSALLMLPYGKERIFNLVPGFAALKTATPLAGRDTVFTLKVK